MSENRGGAREGAGRKPVADEEKLQRLFRNAINKFYKADNDDEGQTRFILDLLTEPKTKKWVAERTWGKPKETVENTMIIPEGSITINSKGDTPIITDGE